MRRKTQVQCGETCNARHSTVTKIATVRRLMRNGTLNRVAVIKPHGSKTQSGSEARGSP